MSKIEWCDITWNPVWGCLTGCKYCYAGDIAKRFCKQIAEKEEKYYTENFPESHIFDSAQMAIDLYNFKLTWIESNFNKKFPKKPSRIFVNSMSDIEYWESEWMESVLMQIDLYPQHTFIFLTKSPFIYSRWIFPSNCWLGVTASTRSEVYHRASQMRYYGTNKTFISMEPIQEHININAYDLEYVSWLIIGAETGNRKNKIIPEKSWIEEFRNIDIPVFMKDNLKAIVGDNLRQEFPK